MNSEPPLASIGTPITASLATPDAPTQSEQLEALINGLGRSGFWAEQKKFDVVPLRFAALHNGVLDGDCEVDRTDWTFKVLYFSGHLDTIADDIASGLEALSHDDLSYPFNGGHVCTLAMWLARRFDDRFADHLWQVVTRHIHNSAVVLGVDEWIRLKGKPGFVAVMTEWGRRIVTPQDSFAFDFDGTTEAHSNQLADAIEAVGRDEVLRLLDANDETRQVRTVWLDREASRQSVDADIEEPTVDPAEPSLSIAEQIVASAKRNDRSPSSRPQFSRYATSTDVNEILNEAMQSDDASYVARLLRPLRLCNWKQPTPNLSFDQRLVDLINRFDEQTDPSGHVRTAAMDALGRVRHDAVRKIAESMLEGQISTSSQLELLQRNYREGDAAIIRDSLRLPDDREERHGLLLTLMSVLNENATDRDARSELLLIVYRFTPCAICRLDAARKLAKLDAFPEWARTECLRDGSYKIRRWAKDGFPNHD